MRGEFLDSRQEFRCAKSTGAKIMCGKIHTRQNLRAAKISRGEFSTRQNLRGVKIPAAKFCTAIFPAAKLLITDVSTLVDLWLLILLIRLVAPDIYSRGLLKDDCF